MSTNDSVIMLANGNSGVKISDPNKKLHKSFSEGLQAVCQSLAKKCVSDGEKVTKFIRVAVMGACTNHDAEKVARSISNSLLVKTSWFGSDPNWGRIVDAAGYAKVGLVFDQIDLFYNQVKVLNKGNLLKAIKLNGRKSYRKKSLRLPSISTWEMEMLRFGQMI